MQCSLAGSGLRPPHAPHARLVCVHGVRLRIHLCTTHLHSHSGFLVYLGCVLSLVRGPRGVCEGLAGLQGWAGSLYRAVCVSRHFLYRRRQVAAAPVFTGAASGLFILLFSVAFVCHPSCMPPAMCSARGFMLGAASWHLYRVWRVTDVGGTSSKLSPFLHPDLLTFSTPPRPTELPETSSRFTDGSTAVSTQIDSNSVPKSQQGSEHKGLHCALIDTEANTENGCSKNSTVPPQTSFL